MKGLLSSPCTRKYVRKGHGEIVDTYSVVVNSFTFWSLPCMYVYDECSPQNKTLGLPYKTHYVTLLTKVHGP